MMIIDNHLPPGNSMSHFAPASIKWMLKTSNPLSMEICNGLLDINEIPHHYIIIISDFVCKSHLTVRNHQSNPHSYRDQSFQSSSFGVLFR